MALKIVGSSPIIHPIKKQHPSGCCFFIEDTGLEEAVLHEGQGKVVLLSGIADPSAPLRCAQDDILCHSELVEESVSPYGYCGSFGSAQVGGREGR